MNILFLDTETTGTDESKHSVIQIGAALHVDGKCVDSFNMHMSPSETSKISLGALKVNGACVKTLRDRKSQREGLLHFLDFILQLKYEGKLYICGHNVHFDLAFIKQMLKENGFEDWDQVVSYRILDTNGIGRFLLDTGSLPSPENVPSGTGLETLALLLGIEVRGRKLHDALEDVKLTAEVYYKLKQLQESLVNGKKKN